MQHKKRNVKRSVQSRLSHKQKYDSYLVIRPSPSIMVNNISMFLLTYLIRPEGRRYLAV